MFEEAQKNREQEIEKSENAMRRATQQADEMKKKLMQAEVKIKQLTQATIKDLKGKLKDKNAEIEVLKEMVKSANM